MTRPAYVSLSALQSLRKVALAVLLAIGLAVFALTRSVVFGDDMHELIEKAGIALIVFCIQGRVWCSLYIGGRKVRDLIDYGPYSMVRNPLYVFTFLGAAGMGAQTGSLIIALGCALATWVVFASVVGREEKALLEVHGEAYADYLRRVPRFIPNPTLWRDEKELSVQPVRVFRTFADGLFFLLAIPIAETFEHFQRIGVLPVLANLP